MEPEVVRDKHVEIKYWKTKNGKNFRIPVHDVTGFEKYFQTKEPAAGKNSRKFYTTEQLKEMEGKLTCGIKLKLPVEEKAPEKKEVVVQQTKQQPKPKPEPIVERIRPPLPTSGPTHFIHIPLSKQLTQIYTNILSTTITQQLLPLSSLHVTLVKFSLKSQDDLKIWVSMLKALKKCKINIKGFGSSGPKSPYANTLFLNVENIDDWVNTIVSKAETAEIYSHDDNENRIKFDKQSQKYVLNKPQVKILKTKGKDLIDQTPYAAALKQLKVSNIPVQQIRISIINSYDPIKGFFDEQVIKF